MPVGGIGDRAVPKDLPGLIEFMTRQLVPRVKEMRAMLNRWAVLPQALTSDSAVFDWTAARAYPLTLDNSIVAVEFVDPADVGDYVILVTQVGGGHTIAGWPSVVRWFGGAPPVITATNGAVDKLTFFWDGTNYYGSAQQNA